MDERKLKILLISSWYPNRTALSHGIFVKRHAEAIAKYSDVFAVYACSDNESGIIKKKENGVVTLINYYKKTYSSIPGWKNIMKLYRYYRGWNKAIREYLKEFGKPDVIHSNVVFPVSILAAYYSIRWKIPFIITEHWSGYFPLDGRYKGFFLKTLSSFAVSKASAVTTVSETLKQKMIDAGLKSRYYVISNVVDIDTFDLKPLNTFRGNTIHFVHTSYQDGERKNVPGIIRAFARFHHDVKDSMLTLIVGTGLEITKFNELCFDLHVKDSVQFLDWKSKEELSLIFHNSDAFVLFSDAETQAVVLLESLCCGIPVISSKCGAPEEFINSKNGLLVDIRNEEQLYQAMLSLAKNKTLYISSEIRNSVKDMVSEKSVAEKFMRMYKDVLKIK